MFKPKAEWSITAEFDSTEDADIKLIKDVSFVSHSFAILSTQIRIQDVIQCKRFSSLHRLLTTTAYVFHFIKSKAILLLPYHREVTLIPCPLVRRSENQNPIG